MKTENVAESHQTDIPYTFPAGYETNDALAVKGLVKRLTTISELRPRVGETKDEPNTLTERSQGVG